MEVKTSLLDNMIGVGDMVLLEPLTEDSFLENLRNRFDHNEIYVSLPVYTQKKDSISVTKPHLNNSAAILFFAASKILIEGFSKETCRYFPFWSWLQKPQ